MAVERLGGIDGIERGENRAAQSLGTRKWLLWAGGAAILLVVVLSRRSAATSMGAGTGGAGFGSGASAQTDLASQAQAAQADIARLTLMNSLQQRLADYQYRLASGTNPGQLRQCISWNQWFTLPQSTRDSFTQQAREGSAVLTPTTQGMCVTPTTTGVAGHLPPTTVTQRRGFFSSGSTVTAVPGASGVPVAGAPPAPGLDTLLGGIVGILGGQGTPVGVPPAGGTPGI